MDWCITRMLVSQGDWFDYRRLFVAIGNIPPPRPSQLPHNRAV
jgi:hypothetical protein